MRIPHLRLRDRIAHRLERLKLELLEEEERDDPRHVVGRSAGGPARVAAEIETLFAQQSADGSIPAPHVPSPEALRAVLPGTIWDATPALLHATAASRQRAEHALLVVIELSSCLHSERVIAELSAARELWEGTFSLLRLRVGDRLSKAYIREVQLADAQLFLTSLPLTLVLERAPAGLSFKALALDPLGPTRDHRRLRALLAGEAQLAPGADQEVLRVKTSGGILELDRGNQFFQPFQLTVPW